VTNAPLVTGATGFAGRHLLDHLLQHEPRLVAWGRPGGAPLPAARADAVAWRAVDLLDRRAVFDAVSDSSPSAVYHCAGAADPRRAAISSAPALRVNVLGTAHLLDAVAEICPDVPVVIAGSALVYRASPGPLGEDAPLGPTGPYGVSKLAQEMLALRSAPARVVIARAFNHAGPGQSDAYVTSSFARQIAEIEAGLRPPVLRVGNLESRRDITDVRDTVRAYRLLAAHGAPRRPYNVCTGQPFRIGDLLARLLEQSRVHVDVDVDRARLRPDDNPVVLGDRSRLTHDTGWRPEIPIEQTLTDLLDAWRRATQALRPS
jgi:GDP-4-dehydro-6-deoxy-D-mannose reductase